MRKYVKYIAPNEKSLWELFSDNISIYNRVCYLVTRYGLSVEEAIQRKDEVFRQKRSGEKLHTGETITEFCKRIHINRQAFYSMRKRKNMSCMECFNYYENKYVRRK